MNPFVPAKKERLYLRMALVGASGSGKSLTGMHVASALAALRGGPLAVIDTEGRSARKYADKVDFDVLDLSGNFSPAEYIKAMRAAVEYGYAVVLVDSFSHAWNGAGGVLEVVDKTGQKMGGNDWAGWSKGRPLQNSLNEAVLTLPIDIIGTMRSKTEWGQQVNPKTGKNEPVKLGLAPVQSADFEYEFDVVAYMDMQHTLSITKTRCSLLDGEAGLTDTDYLAGTLHAWLTDGVAPENPASLAKNYLQTAIGREDFRAFRMEMGIQTKDHDAFYLAGLGNLKGYGEYPGTYQDMTEAMQQIRDNGTFARNGALEEPASEEG